MALRKFLDFLSSLVKSQRSFFASENKPGMDALLAKLMGNSGEVSAMVAARELLDLYHHSDGKEKLALFNNLEQNFNANQAAVKIAYDNYALEPSSSNLNRLSRAAEPRRQELLLRLNQTPGATNDLVTMRKDLLALLPDNPQLKAVDEDFQRLFTSWFARSFLVLQTINWSTSAAILERIIRYEAVHEIQSWQDLRSRIEPSNRRCFAFFHPALVDEPLIFVQVALSQEIPGSIATILDESAETALNPDTFTTATFYSISNCQPGLRNISFGNLLIKQVVQMLQAEFPSIKQFVTLSPIPDFRRWLNGPADMEPRELSSLKAEVKDMSTTPETALDHGEQIKKLALNYLVQAKGVKYPIDPVARFHLGNGAMIYQLHAGADLSDKGLEQSLGTMVNYLYDLRFIERNHERYVAEGYVEYSDKLKTLIMKPQKVAQKV